MNSIDFGMAPTEAVTVPRVHCEGPVIHAEATVQSRAVEELRALGHGVRHSHLSFDPVMGRAHVVSALEAGLKGGSDPRGGAGVAYAW